MRGIGRKSKGIWMRRKKKKEEKKKTRSDMREEEKEGGSLRRGTKRYWKQRMVKRRETGVLKMKMKKARG